MTRSVLSQSVFPGQSLFQLGYVTNDLGQALENFKQRYGIERFFRYDGLIATLGQGKEAQLDVALAFIGDTQIELIHPRGGDDHIYREPLPESSFGVRLHHLGYKIDDQKQWDAMLDAVAKNGDTIALEGESKTSRYLYTDNRDCLGHYLEYLWFNQAGLENIKNNFPRN